MGTYHWDYADGDYYFARGPYPNVSFTSDNTKHTFTAPFWFGLLLRVHIWSYNAMARYYRRQLK